MTDDLGDISTEETSEPPEEEDTADVTLDDFVAYGPNGTFIFTPCRETWIGRSVDACLPPMPALNKQGKQKHVKGKPVTIPASRWLMQNRRVLQTTWVPGLPMLIEDRLMTHGGWIAKKHAKSFNLYRPPLTKLGNSSEAQPWLDHLHRIFSDEDADQVQKWLAHRVQRPGEKINHALLIGGAQGIGKDTLLEPVKQAVGPWNFHDISPDHLMESFNDYAKAVILRINEGRDLGDIDRFKFYDHTKKYAAAPPDVLRVNEKHLRAYYVPNCLGLIISTNHKTDGVFLPTDDRRHYVAWTDREKEDFPRGYWNALWGYYQAGGFEHVAAYLTELDLSDFDPKAPPPKTAAFWDIINAGQAPEDAELADVIDAMGQPDALTPKQLIATAGAASE